MVRRESLTLAKELEEKLVGLEDRLEEIDPDRVVRKAWAALAHALEIEIEDVETSKAGAFFRSLIRGLTRSPRPSTGKDLRPLELVKDLAVAFLKGPVGIVVSDASTEVAEAVAVHEESAGGDLTGHQLSALRQGIDNLTGSALYPMSYKFICHTFDQLAKGQILDPEDDLPIYPPGSRELVEITERMIELRGQFVPLEQLIDKGLEDSRLLGDPRYRSELKHAVESSETYREFRRQSKDLTLAVIGPAATGFLIKAVESIPRVEPYLQQVMKDVERDSAADPDYVKMLIEAPPYVRVICYISEANDDGHHITGARVPFPVATSEMTREELDGMLSRLFGARATSNPFHSTQRAHFFASNPLQVAEQYRQWRASKGLAS